MPAQGRLGDRANVPLDTHGCPACPHPAIGPAIQGSPDVSVNRRPALRVDDPGVHAACCGTNTWIATAGSATVFINGKGAHRVGDQNRHCGGQGRLVEGSPNVFVGESAGGRSDGSTATSSPSGDGATRGPSHREAASRDQIVEGSVATADAAPPNRVVQSVNGEAAASPSADLVSAAPAFDGSTELAAPPSKPEAADEPTWIEIVLLGEDGKAIPGERYIVILPDGKVRTGRLDSDGHVKLTGLAQGTCEVSFPDLDSEAWVPADGG